MLYTDSDLEGAGQPCRAGPTRTASDGISWYMMVRDMNWAGLSFAELRLKWVGQALSKTSARTHKSPANNPAHYHPQYR